MSLFGKKEKEEISNLNSQINSLEEQIKQSKIKEAKFENIIEKKDLEIRKISKSPHDKQFEKITLEFDKVMRENTTLKQLNDSLKGINFKLVEENNKIIKEGDPRYKVLIKDLYSARKHDEFKRSCEIFSLIYVEDLKNFDFDRLIKEGRSKTKVKNAKDQYLKFKNGDFSSEIKEYIIYGHRISKVFFRYRSFVSYLINLKIEYLYQLDKFDFTKLVGENFTSIQIKKFNEKLKEYNDLRKI